MLKWWFQQRRIDAQLLNTEKYTGGTTVNILGYAQRIGRALMVPVAVLPAAAILMGVGYWLDPTGWGANNALAAFMIKSGAAIIENMSVLFAIGVAYGMSKDKDGAARLRRLYGDHHVMCPRRG